MKNENTVVAILAGGQARRMNGVDKGLVVYKEKPMIAHVLERVVNQSPNVIINANRNIEAYKTSGLPVVEDDLVNKDGSPSYQGPLAGMCSVMQYIFNHKSDYQGVETVTFVPCDAPLLPLNLVEKSVNRLTELKAEIAVPFAGRSQPVFATINISLLPSLYDFLHNGGRKIDAWFKEHYWIQVDFNVDTPLFANYNTPDDIFKNE